MWSPQITLNHMQLQIFPSYQIGKYHKLFFKKKKCLAKGWKKQAFLYITRGSINWSSHWEGWFSNGNSNKKCAHPLIQKNYFYKYNLIYIWNRYMHKLFILAFLIRSEGWKQSKSLLLRIQLNKLWGHFYAMK